jgi:hypothetical protein
MQSIHVFLRSGLGFVIGLLASSCVNAQTIFSDSFETFVPACVSGALDGTTLPVPALGGAVLLGCFEIRNDASARSAEAAYGSLPIPRSSALGDADFARLVVIGPGGRRWPAEFAVLSRWGRPLADTSAPVRWLSTTLAIDIAEQGGAVLALMRLPLVPNPDPGGLTIAQQGAVRMIDTGLAEFSVDATLSQPITRIQVREISGGPLLEVFARQPGSADEGWSVRVLDAAGALILEASEAISGSMVVDRARWEAGSGPVQAILHIDGHLQAANGAARCPGNASWLRFPISTTLRFTRGSRDVDFEWQLGNACGNPQSVAEEALVQIEHAQFRLPLARGVEAQSVALAATTGAMRAFPMASVSAYRMTQRRGGGTPWRRRAELTEDGALLESSEFFGNPAIGIHRPLVSGRLNAIAQQPWLRYREPQGLEAFSGRVAFRFVTESVRLGKAKSLWFAGRLGIAVAADVSGAMAAANDLKQRGVAALERGLTLRAELTSLDAAQILPPLAGTLTSAPGQGYTQYLDIKHADTIGDEPCLNAGNDVGSQWTCSKTFGSQLWPDVQFNNQFGFVDNASPESNEGKLNYWDPAHIELVEFIRTGDPRWLWEFALPQSRLMSYTAYYNFGTQRGSNISGHSFGSGGSGDGTWHRSASGSADYTYNRHQALAYVLRPNAAMRDRMAASGHAAGLRFSDNPNDNTTWSAIGRLNLQYIESLANCAQFVPGAEGVACDTRLREVLTRLIDTSLSSGLMCEVKFNLDSQCFLGQYFMLHAWYYPILERLYLNYGHTFPTATSTRWRRALVETPVTVLANLPRDGAGAVVVGANWPGGLQCQLGGPGFSQVLACTVIPDPDNLDQNKPALMSVVLRGHDYDNARGLCSGARAILNALLAGPDPLGTLRIVARGGWWKGAAESAQELVNASTGYERCAP